MNELPEPAVGEIWLSRYTTGLRVAITETDGLRVRIADLDSRTGIPRPRGRWCTITRLRLAYVPST
ncbi:hypothetical protein PL81_38815 [Streptomyces sp. RSD-27]|nr:hypothetical protein PL81_38815 [Streptomyces sp. RSD-27]